MGKKERKILFDNYYIALFNDGTIGVSDGVGYSGDIDKDEVRKLYKVLCKFFKGD